MEVLYPLSNLQQTTLLILCSSFRSSSMTIRQLTNIHIWKTRLQWCLNLSHVLLFIIININFIIITSGINMETATQLFPKDIKFPSSWDLLQWRISSIIKWTIFGNPMSWKKLCVFQLKVDIANNWPMRLGKLCYCSGHKGWFNVVFKEAVLQGTHFVIPVLSHFLEMNWFWYFILFIFILLHFLPPILLQGNSWWLTMLLQCIIFNWKLKLR